MIGRRGSPVLALSLLALQTGCGEGVPAAADRAQAIERTPSASTTAEDATPLSGLESLVVAADSTYAEQDYAAARAIFDDVRSRAGAGQDTRIEAYALTWMGLASWRLGDFTAARRFGEQALALKEGAGLQADLSLSYNALGLLAWDEVRLEDARGLFERSVDAARISGDERGVGRGLGNLGLVYTELGDFESARVGFQALLDVGRHLGEARLEGNALSNLGMVELRMGAPDRAIPLLEEALALHEGVHFDLGRQVTFGHLASAYTAVGDPARAYAYLDSALTLARGLGLSAEEARNVELMARFYHDAGDLRRALELYERSRALYEEVGLPLEGASTLRSEADIRSELGDAEGGLRLAEEALRVHEELGARFEELFDRLLIPELAAAGGAVHTAEEQLDAAAALVRRMDSPVARAALALSRARVAEAEGEPERVLAVLSAAEPDLEVGAYGALWSVWVMRARAWAQLERLDSASTAALSAVAAVDAAGARLGGDVLGSSYRAERSTVYTDAVEILLRQGRVGDAFRVAEAARGRTLLQHLASGGGASGTATELARSASEGERLLREIDGLIAELDSIGRLPQTRFTAERDERSAELRGRIASARRDYAALVARAGLAEPEASALLGLRPVGEAEVRAGLEPGEALIEFLVATDKVWLFVIDRAGVRTVSAPLGAEDLANRVRIVRERASQPTGQASSSAMLSALYDALLVPAARTGALQGVRKLFLVPHGPLRYLPFAALRNEATERYLIEDYEIAVLPSASALPLLRPSAPFHAAAGVAFAPFPRELPGTRAEARAVRRALRGGEAVLGDEATEAMVRAALASDGVVHLATHGTMNAFNPMFSRIALARGDGTSDDDGRLEVHEVSDLTIRSALVFLSGCDTGVGAGGSTRFLQGEDFATLAQSFLLGGAANVVATLWSIDDEGAAVFAERFYRALRSRSPVEALAQAQRETARDPRWGSTHYWAGYEIAGVGGSSRGGG